MISFKQILLTLIIILFLGTINFVNAQSEDRLYLPDYHHDEHQHIKRIKLIRKYLDKNADSLQVLNDILDSLDDLEHDRINYILNKINNSSHFEYDNYFANKNISQGRQSSLNGWCYNPSLTFRHKGGIYSQMMFYKYADTSIKSRLPELDFTIGYYKSFANNFTMDIGYSHSFIFYGNKQSRELLINNISVYSSYDFDVLCLSSNINFSWGGTDKTPEVEKHATQLDFYLDKYFVAYHFLGSYKFSVDPTLRVSCGSDNYFHIRNRIYSENKGEKPKYEVITNTFWGLLAIDMSVYVKYRIKHLDFYLTPKFAVPFNVDVNNRDNSAGTPIFYFTAGINYRFRLWNEK